jgi:hypothetical protein
LRPGCAIVGLHTESERDASPGRGMYRLWNGVWFAVPRSRRRASGIGYHRDLRVTPTAAAATHSGRRTT